MPPNVYCHLFPGCKDTSPMDLAKGVEHCFKHNMANIPTEVLWKCRGCSESFYLWSSAELHSVENKHNISMPFSAPGFLPQDKFDQIDALDAKILNLMRQHPHYTKCTTVNEENAKRGIYKSDEQKRNFFKRQWNNIIWEKENLITRSRNIVDHSIPTEDTYFCWYPSCSQSSTPLSLLESLEHMMSHVFGWMYRPYHCRDCNTAFLLWNSANKHAHANNHKIRIQMGDKDFRQRAAIMFREGMNEHLHLCMELKPSPEIQDDDANERDERPPMRDIFWQIVQGSSRSKDCQQG